MKKYHLLSTLLCFVFLFLFVFEAIVIAEDPKATQSRSANSWDYSQIDINNIKAWITNYGSVFRHPTTGIAGFEYPANSGLFAIYASGLWLSAKINSNIHMAIAEYSYEFQPGKIISPGQWGNPSDPRYQVYKMNPGDAFPQVAIQDGAPAYFPGDQFLWCLYNDADSAIHVKMNAPPLEAEVQQWFFGFNAAGPIGHTIFGKWIIINKSSSEWDSTYITIWSDPDIGDAGDDFVGFDTTRNLGYAYNSSNFDYEYGASPPAAGYTLLQGPIVPSPGDTAIFLGKFRSNYKNLPITNFIYYNANSTAMGHPQTAPEARNYQMAHWRDGIALTYGGNGYGGTTPTQFAFTGNPETGTGWLDSSPADRHFLMNMGPLHLAAGDTQEVVFAVIAARGADNLNSVTLLKQYANTVRLYYDILLATGIEDKIEPPTKYDYHLFPNYPNPFNPTTTIKYNIPNTSKVVLKIYNLLGNEIATLVNEKQNAGAKSITWNGRNQSGHQVSSGIYIYQLKAGDYAKTRKMIFLK